MNTQKKLEEALELLKYFTDRVEAGTIRSVTTYGKYKEFINRVKTKPDGWALDVSLHRGHSNLWVTDFLRVVTEKEASMTDEGFKEWMKENGVLKLKGTQE